VSNILIVTAHPSSKGFTHKAALEIRRVKSKKGHEVEIIDLYKENKQEFLFFEDKGDDIINDQIRSYQLKITNSDEIIFVYPCWWGDCPSIMRNWFDLVFSKNYAFKYTGRRPQGLLAKKVCSIVMTTGSPKLIYTLNGVSRAMKKIWKTTRIEFCGMKLKSFIVLGGMDTRGRNEINALSEVTKLALK